MYIKKVTHSNIICIEKPKHVRVKNPVYLEQIKVLEMENTSKIVIKIF